MSAVMAFCGICLLLVVGILLRTAFPLFQRLFLPASVIGGLVGLVLINTVGSGISSRWYAPWSSLPGFLINIVFASLFIGMQGGGRKLWKIVAPQVVFGQIAAWGQYVMGFGLVALVLARVYGVPPIFGNLMEIGFEGGHGTVGGMTATFRALDWPQGAALGYTIATIGMIFGIVIGMALINIGARRGYVCNIRTFEDQGDLEKKASTRRMSSPTPASKPRSPTRWTPSPCTSRWSASPSCSASP